MRWVALGSWQVLHKRFAGCCNIKGSLGDRTCIFYLPHSMYYLDIRTHTLSPQEYFPGQICLSSLHIHSNKLADGEVPLITLPTGEFFSVKYPPCCSAMSAPTQFELLCTLEACVFAMWQGGHGLIMGLKPQYSATSQLLKLKVLRP